MTVFVTLVEIDENNVAEFMDSNERYFQIDLSRMEKEALQELKEKRMKRSAIKIEISLTKKE